LEREQHLVLLHELANLLDRLRRAVTVVVADEDDLAAVDAAFLAVDLVEIGGDGLADGAVGRGRPAIWVGVADLDLGIADAGTILGGLGRERGYGKAEDHARRYECSSGYAHSSLL
jgi:hypothetical protein